QAGDRAAGDRGAGVAARRRWGGRLVGWQRRAKSLDRTNPELFGGWPQTFGFNAVFTLRAIVSCVESTWRAAECTGPSARRAGAGSRAMNRSGFVVEFVGGPSDGLVRCERRFAQRDKLYLPLAPALVRCGQRGCYELTDRRAATYLLRARHR